MKTVAQAIAEAQQLASQHNIPLADLIWLLEDITGMSRSAMLLNPCIALSVDREAKWQSYLQRRVLGEPSQYITGKAWFYGRCFEVNPSCLIPRPETEGLVEHVLKHKTSVGKRLRVLDIGTGSGAIAISLALESPAWEIHATDISATALDVARRNAEQLEACVKFIEADLFSQSEGLYDLIVSNPPYISESDYRLLERHVRDFEPVSALLADEDGLAVYRRILEACSSYLSPEGYVYFEIGSNQSEAIKSIAKKQGFTKIETRQDLAGRDRYLIVSI